MASPRPGERQLLVGWESDGNLSGAVCGCVRAAGTGQRSAVSGPRQTSAEGRQRSAHRAEAEVARRKVDSYPAVSYFGGVVVGAGVTVPGSLTLYIFSTWV